MPNTFMHVPLTGEVWPQAEMPKAPFKQQL